jgi:hypothetical protein
MSACNCGRCKWCALTSKPVEAGVMQYDVPPKPDPINPSHYRSHPSGVEAITITEHFNFNIGNATKYLWRAGLKSPDPLEDLRKSAWYVAREISRVESELKGKK